MEIEAFNLIRAHLRFFNVDRDLRTLMIASPASSDGKTTIALNLAVAAARLGSRVLLVEGDLRRPTLAGQLGVQPGPGLAGVLMGDVSADEAIRAVALDTWHSEPATAGGHTLDVLVAGDVLPPNPGKLLESHAMTALLASAKSGYELVVIDTPPLTVVSDAFSLLGRVDGVVIVGWIGKSRRDSAEQLQQVIAGSGAPLLGVVANGSKPRSLGSYADRTPRKQHSPVGVASGSPSSEQLAEAANT